ncbi:SOS response-associated peptidase [Fluviicola sp.]|uniref:SOS response-associated peptidase n=1 Tax=Fluviicola sp. TaxID=1917219 RepID=UPI0031D4E6A5
MCGRVISPSSGEIKDKYGLSGPEADTAINVPPSGASVPVFRSGTEFEMFSWPLIPKWSKTKKMAWDTSNARLEKFEDPKSMWFRLKETQPCAIFTKGFYEWQQVDPMDRKTKKIPYVIRTTEPLTVMAGLWDEWKNPTDGSLLHSCTIITMEGNDLMKEIHNIVGDKNGRMPAFLTRETMGLWTDTTLPYIYRREALIEYPNDFLIAKRVGDVTDSIEILSALGTI